MCVSSFYLFLLALALFFKCILHIENNNLSGNMKECRDISITTNCVIPRKISCQCCHCFGVYSTFILYEKTLPYLSSQLKIFFNNRKNKRISFELLNDSGEIFY